MVNSHKGLKFGIFENLRDFFVLPYIACLRCLYIIESTDFMMLGLPQYLIAYWSVQRKDWFKQLT